MKDLEKKKKDKELTDHHILPSSRKGKDTPKNIKRVPDSFHKSYHHLFCNLAPDEVIEYLKEVWFESKTDFITPQKWMIDNNIGAE